MEGYRYIYIYIYTYLAIPNIHNLYGFPIQFLNFPPIVFSFDDIARLQDLD